jgi:hypothetical protein
MVQVRHNDIGSYTVFCVEKSAVPYLPTEHMALCTCVYTHTYD